jgi:hypothetical protein
MTDTQWGWCLLVCELAGLAAMSHLVGRRRFWWGWLVVFACVSAPWVAYSIATSRLPFLVLSVLWAGVHMTNAYRWKRDPDDDY